MALHHFQPDHYHVTIGSHPPVLRLHDGDRVVTTTVDAAGMDGHGIAVTARGNPMTGPFFIEDAEPGDTLAVRLDRIRPNRTYGWSGVMIAPNIVDPSYVPALPWPAPDDRQRAEWHVDVAENTASLVHPAVRPLTLPLSPMLGCFGVAPAYGQAISTATSGPYGGNMDYRGFVEGVMVYFPVLVPGALFHLGDGHALQGDGEIVGTGIEISMDVEFTVHLIKGSTINWPRGETTDTIFTVGNARPLDQCVQHATTEMVLWLQQEYGLEPLAAQILLGQCVTYDLGNMFDPAYTMVCKLSRHLL